MIRSEFLTYQQRINIECYLGGNLSVINYDHDAIHKAVCLFLYIAIGYLLFFHIIFILIEDHFKYCFLFDINLKI